MTSFVEVLRGNVVESRHRVSAVVARADARLVATTGDSGLVTFWRSAAKFFQAVPLLVDGAADALGIQEDELALACASHNGEAGHVAVARRLLERSGSAESDLVCGPHASLSDAVARAMELRGEKPSKANSNCSGKHAGMLALARHHGWNKDYAPVSHEVQRRCLAEVSKWTGTPEASIRIATDGCGVPSFALPLDAMAVAYARMAEAAGGDGASGMSRLVAAVRRHPFMIAGTGRLDTQILETSGGAVIAKVGAEGVYCAALLDAGLGLALKVEDGDGRSVGPALLAALEVVAPGVVTLPNDLREPPVTNSLGAVVGRFVPRVTLSPPA